MEKYGHEVVQDYHFPSEEEIQQMEEYDELANEMREDREEQEELKRKREKKREDTRLINAYCLANMWIICGNYSKHCLEVTMEVCWIIFKTMSKVLSSILSIVDNMLDNTLDIVLNPIQHSSTVISR